MARGATYPRAYRLVRDRVFRRMPTQGGDTCQRGPVPHRNCHVCVWQVRGRAGRIMADPGVHPRAYRDVCVWSIWAYPVLRMVQAHPRATSDVETGVCQPPGRTFSTPRGGAWLPDDAAQAGRGTAGKRLDDDRILWRQWRQWRQWRLHAIVAVN